MTTEPYPGATPQHAIGEVNETAAEIAEVQAATRAHAQEHGYIVIDLDPQAHPSDWAPGAQVRQVYGLAVNRTGQIVAWGRASKAHRKFLANKAAAEEAQRELGNDDYEPLIDNEGPVVLFGDGKQEWFPGQAMSCLELIPEDGDDNPQFIVVMTVSVPGTAWRNAYGPRLGPIVAGALRRYLQDGLFVDGTQIHAKVHEVRAL